MPSIITFGGWGSNIRKTPGIRIVGPLNWVASLDNLGIYRCASIRSKNKCFFMNH